MILDHVPHWQIFIGNSEYLIHFGQGHDAKFADLVSTMIPENSIGIMDRGFASWEFFDEMRLTKTMLAVRIKNKLNLTITNIELFGFVIWRAGANFVWQPIWIR